MKQLIEMVNEQQSVVDFQSIKPKLMDHLKHISYNFFIFYSKTSSNSSSSNLQKIALRIRQEKSMTYIEKKSMPFEKNNNQTTCNKNQKQVYLYFCELENEQDVDQSLFDLKLQLLQNKNKVVIYDYQSALIALIKKATSFGIDFQQIPFVIYSPGLHNDLALYLGWQDMFLANFIQKTPHQFQQHVKKWISSPSQKIDLWEAQVTVKEHGAIYMLEPNGVQYTLLPQKQLKQCFFSHFSAGYHSKLAIDYEVKKKSDNSKIINTLIYNFQSFKKFCCVGSPNVKTATGVVNIQFKDQKDHQIQILKEFRQHQGESEENMGKVKRSIPQRKILTILMSNIDCFQGQKLKNVKSTKMNDSKIELISFESGSEYTEIYSISKDTTLKFQSEEEIFIQINNICYKLQHAESVRVKLVKKMKALINKDTLEC